MITQAEIEAAAAIIYSVQPIHMQGEEVEPWARIEEKFRRPYLVIAKLALEAAAKARSDLEAAE